MGSEGDDLSSSQSSLKHRVCVYNVDLRESARESQPEGEEAEHMAVSAQSEGRGTKKGDFFISSCRIVVPIEHADRHLSL